MEKKKRRDEKKNNNKRIKNEQRNWLRILIEMKEKIFYVYTKK